MQTPVRLLHVTKIGLHVHLILTARLRRSEAFFGFSCDDLGGAP